MKPDGVNPLGPPEEHGRDGSPSRPLTGCLGEASLPRRKWLRHDAPAWVRNATFFVTINCRNRGENLLCSESIFAVLRDAVAFYHSQRWWAHLWLCMPDHVHALLSFPRGEAMKGVVADWKRFTARKAGIEWQPGFFDHRLRDTENFDEKAHYIRMNPVRAGLVARPEEWPCVATAADFLCCHSEGAIQP